MWTAGATSSGERGNYRRLCGQLGMHLYLRYNDKSLWTARAGVK